MSTTGSVCVLYRIEQACNVQGEYLSLKFSQNQCHS